ncbi:MAG: oligoendopeptidase F [Thermaerobacter sp.]|nr:oligoendopeptidase F [Thermaerobacter sp.]
MSDTIRSRSEQDASLQWNLEDLYPARAAWQEALTELVQAAQSFGRLRGHLGKDGRTLLDALREEDSIGSRLERFYAYAMFCHDQDTQDPEGTEMVAKAQSIAAQLGEATAFVVPELVALPEGRIAELVAAERGLEEYAHTFQRIERMRQHVLEPAEEALLAAFSPVLQGADTVAGQLSNADLDFGEIEDSKGNRLPLSHGRYGQYVMSTDRKVRQEAYLGIHAPYAAHRHTFAATLDQQMRTAVTEARVRRYPSALEAELDSRALPTTVYDNLLEEVHAALPDLQRYIAWRKQQLGLHEFHFYDIYPPIAALADEERTWDEASAEVTRALGPLGEQYRERLQRILTQRYVDVLENRGKRSGAYSMGIYDVHPYILMTYTGTRDSMFTLAHEAGHAMHSILASEAQGYRGAQYPIFLAEIASTCNEHLLLHHLIHQAQDPKLLLDLRDDLAQKFVSTVFRQTLFAEFERAMHERVEQGGALTAEYLQETYHGLLRRYYGPALEIDEVGTYEWARIPHFYMGYYVFQYATGFIAAAALSREILEKGEEAASRYLAFLAAGGSDDPLPILARAGVDLSQRDALHEGLQTFARTVSELEQR